MSDLTGSTSVIQSGFHTCTYCGPGIYHMGVCPKIAAIQYHPDGSVARVEFHTTVAFAPAPDRVETKEAGDG